MMLPVGCGSVDSIIKTLHMTRGFTRVDVFDLQMCGVKSSGGYYKAVLITKTPVFGINLPRFLKTFSCLWSKMCLRRGKNGYWEGGWTDME